MRKDPEWDGDVMAYMALVAEYNKRYDERERQYNCLLYTSDAADE